MQRRRPVDSVMIAFIFIVHGCSTAQDRHRSFNVKTGYDSEGNNAGSSPVPRRLIENDAGTPTPSPGTGDGTVEKSTAAGDSERPIESSFPSNVPTPGPSATPTVEPIPGKPDIQSEREEKPPKAGTSSGLPDVVLDSDVAQKPYAVLTAPSMGPSRGAPVFTPQNYVLAPFRVDQSDGLPPIQCSPSNYSKSRRDYTLICDYAELVNGESYPMDIYSWSFTIRNCPDARFAWNYIGSNCSGKTSSTCERVVPSTKIGIPGLVMETCLGQGAELIYQITDKGNGMKTTQVFTLQRRP